MKILILPGDGIGPEVIHQTQKIINKLIKNGFDLEYEYGLAGASCIKQKNVPIEKNTLQKAAHVNAVLLGAVGAAEYDHLPIAQRPEQAVLTLRKTLGLYANLRPVKTIKSLGSASPLKEEIVENADLIVVRELTGGIYFGNPRDLIINNGSSYAFNTEIYHDFEIRRIACLAFETARKRRKKVVSVDKANVLESSMLWRKIVNETHFDYPDIELDHMYVDNCAMQLIRNPMQFDVILTNNMFGDILSDESAMIGGSIGLLPSVSIGEGCLGLYEPVHGSAPDIADQNIANPCAAILSVALMFRYSLGSEKIAQAIEKAVIRTLEKGLRTADIAFGNEGTVGTSEMGDYIVEELEKILRTMN